MQASPTEYKRQRSGAEDSIENMNSTIKETAQCKKDPNSKHPGNLGQNEKTNLQKIEVDENEDFQLKGPLNIFNKIIEENFPNLKKEMPMSI